MVRVDSPMGMEAAAVRRLRQAAIASVRGEVRWIMGRVRLWAGVWERSGALWERWGWGMALWLGL